MDVDRLRQINIANLTNICKHHMQLSYLDCRSRASIYSMISGQQIIVQEAINGEASNTIQSGLMKYGWKSKESESGQGPSKQQKTSQHVVDGNGKNGEECVRCNKENID